MASTSYSRRRLLAAIAAAGGAARLAPFLPASVRAATAPKRILTIFSPMGYLENSFFPSGTGTNFTLGETQTALQAWKDKLIYLDGIGIYGAPWYFHSDDNEHGTGSNMVFTGAKKAGYATGPSIEQAVADHQYAQAKTQYRALGLGVNAPSPGDHSAVFYSKSQTPVTAQNSPQAVFDMLFKNFSGPTLPPVGQPAGGGAPMTNPPLDTSAIDRARKQQQSVLNFVKDDLKRVETLAGQDDRQKVEAHLEGIRSLENRLKLLGGQPMSPPMTAAPTTPKVPTAPAGTASEGCAKPTLSAKADLEGRVHSQMDLIASAFACDMTRSISLQLALCDGGMDEGFPEIKDGQHNVTHAIGDGKGQASDIANHKIIDRWYVARWAYLLNRLNSIKEGNGTLLDNTLILFGSDTTTVQNNEVGAHSHLRFPLWMAGGGNFAFKTGQAIKLGANKKSGCCEWSSDDVPHQRLLTSIAQAFGLPVETFGSNDPGRGPLAGLTRV